MSYKENYDLPMEASSDRCFTGFLLMQPWASQTGSEPEALGMSQGAHQVGSVLQSQTAPGEGRPSVPVAPAALGLACGQTAPV